MPVEHEVVHGAVHEHVQVRPVERGFEVGAGRAPALERAVFAFDGVVIGVDRALVRGRVRVGDHGEAAFAGGIHQRVCDRMHAGEGSDPHRAVETPEGRIAAGP